MRSAILRIRVMFLMLDNIGMRVYYAFLKGLRKKNAMFQANYVVWRIVMFKLVSTIVRWIAHLARKRTPSKNKPKKKERLHRASYWVKTKGARTGGWGVKAAPPNFTKIWNFPGKTLMIQETAVEVKIKIKKQQQHHKRLSCPIVRLHGNLSNQGV